MDWKADSLQGVLFTTPGASQLDAQQLWSLLTDSLPENVQRPSTTPNSLSIATGPFKGNRLTVQSQLGRINWILSASPPVGMPTEPPRIENYEEVSGQLNEILESALASVRPVRVALVGEFGLVFSSEVELVSFLSEQTGGVWFPEPAQDCIYQINVRKAYAGLNDINMNRLVTWSGSMYQLFSGSISLGGISQNLTPSQVILAASLKIDINSHTSSDISKFAPDMIAAHRKEMLSIARSGLSYLK